MRILFAAHDSRRLRAFQEFEANHGCFDINYVSDAAEATLLLQRNEYLVLVADYQQIYSLDALSLLSDARDVSPLTSRLLLHGQAGPEIDKRLGEALSNGVAWRAISADSSPEDLLSTIWDGIHAYFGRDEDAGLS